MQPAFSDQDKCKEKIDLKYENLKGRFNTALGNLIDQAPTQDGGWLKRYQYTGYDADPSFPGLSIYCHGNGEAFEIHGFVRGKWLVTGAETGPLGFPVQDQFETPNKSGQGANFEHGSIHWKRGGSGAFFTLYGPIWDKWAEQSWEQSNLGFPVRDLSRTAGYEGSWEAFEKGVIYVQDADRKAYIIRAGPIYDKWQTQGYEMGNLGYPTSDERWTPYRDGVRQFFENGAIYTSSHGTFGVHGKIFDQYSRLDTVTGNLGYPTTDVIDLPGGNGAQYSNFEFGTICLMNGNTVWTGDRLGPSACKGEAPSEGSVGFILKFFSLTTLLFVGLVVGIVTAIIIILRSRRTSRANEIPLKRKKSTLFVGPREVHDPSDVGEYVGIVRNLKNVGDNLNYSMILQSYNEKTKSPVEPVFVRIKLYNESDKYIDNKDIVQIIGRWETEDEFVAERLYNYSKKMEIMFDF